MRSAPGQLLAPALPACRTLLKKAAAAAAPDSEEEEEETAWAQATAASHRVSSTANCLDGAAVLVLACACMKVCAAKSDNKNQRVRYLWKRARGWFPTWKAAGHCWQRTQPLHQLGSKKSSVLLGAQATLPPAQLSAWPPSRRPATQRGRIGRLCVRGVHDSQSLKKQNKRKIKA